MNLLRLNADDLQDGGKKVYVPSFKTPLKLCSFAKPLDRLCSMEPPKDSPFGPVLPEFFHGVKRNLPTTSGSFVVPDVRSPCPLKRPTQYSARP